MKKTYVYTIVAEIEMSQKDMDYARKQYEDPTMSDDKVFELHLDEMGPHGYHMDFTMDKYKILKLERKQVK